MDVALSLGPDTSGIVMLTEAQLRAASPEERARYARYLRRELHKVDPVRWGGDVLGEAYWSKQREVLYSVARNRRTAVRSCHETGKSFAAARAAAWWLSQELDRFVLSTAPSFPQVSAILWKEINRAHKSGGLPGRTNLTEWYIGGELVAMGRKPNDYEPSALQGIHAKDGVLVIYDEADGIPESLFVAGASMAANKSSRELAIGNPDTPGSHFQTLFRPNSSWTTVTISAFDTPNFTGEHVAPEVAASLIDEDYVADMERDHGKTSPFYVSKVLGEFPTNKTDGVIPFSWLQACRHELAPVIAEGATVAMGVDVGGSATGDETVVRVRRGMVAGERHGWRTNDPMETVGDVWAIAIDIDATIINVDATGIGHGVWGRLRELAEIHLAETGVDIAVNGIMVGQAAEGQDTEGKPNREVYVNLKAQLWWEIGRELSRQKVWNLSALDDETVDQLSEHRYRKDSAGRVRIEAKDDIKKRIGRSPDDADAVILAFYEPPVEGPAFLGSA